MQDDTSVREHQPGQGLSVAEAARRLGVSHATVRKWIVTGQVCVELADGPHGKAYRVHLDAATTRALTKPSELRRGLSVIEVANRTGFSKQRVYRMIARGELQATARAQPQGIRYEADPASLALLGATMSPPEPGATADENDNS